MEPHWPPPTDWVVPTIVQFKLTKWLTREVGEERADQVIAYTQICHVVALDTPIALAAAEAARAHKLPTADAIVFATVQGQRAAILTCGGQFKGLPAPLAWPAR
ncbi:MAG: PIN domain-containing protein [Rubrivivax sp.]|nr:PIN domain-containing protein [Rubrivivax sp.]